MKYGIIRKQIHHSALKINTHTQIAQIHLIFHHCIPNHTHSYIIRTRYEVYKWLKSQKVKML